MSEKSRIIIHDSRNVIYVIKNPRHANWQKIKEYCDYIPTCNDERERKGRKQEVEIYYLQVDVGGPMKSSGAGGKGSTEPQPGRAET